MTPKRKIPKKPRKPTPKQTLDAIHTLMDGTEWDSTTLDAISMLLQEAGYIIHEPE